MKNNPALLDQCWQWLTMALVGEELDEGDEICGAVVSLRSKVDRIQLWTRSKDDVEKVNGIGRKFVKLLDVSEADGIGLEFQASNYPRSRTRPNNPPALFSSPLLKCLRPPLFSITRRIVRSRTNSSRYRPSLSRPSGRRFIIIKELAVPLQGLVKVPGLPAPAQAGHFRASAAVVR